MNLYLCSFASPDLKKSIKRFLDQSYEIDIYKETKVFTFKDLDERKQNQINEFFNKKQKRLFGYACWKPEVILGYLKKIPDESILQYSDIGCHLNKNGLKRLNDYVELANKNNILAFQYKKPNFENNENLKYQIYSEQEYTKEDLFNFFDIPKSSSIRTSEQIWSGTIFFKKNLTTIKLLNKWCEICDISKLIDDTPSEEKNYHNFVEHRHDQSAFSILCKINKIECVSASECEWAENEKGRHWDHLKYFPILAKRDKKFNLLKRFYVRQLKNIKRIFNK
tara:strand:- start:1058 stop:1897 length:840 start_codon:yes stop_codon:yes gene_type:complete